MKASLDSIMVGSEDSKRLADFYQQVLGDPNPEWSDQATGWFGFQVGNGAIIVGPHSEVHGQNKEPGRLMINMSTSDLDAEFERIKGLGAQVIAEPYNPGGDGSMKMCTFADADGNYFQLSTPWDAGS